MVLVAGFSVALSAYYLQVALLSRPPGFDGQAVSRLGLGVAALMFALSGPVMVLRATGKVLAAEHYRRIGLAHLMALILVSVWAGLIGFVVLAIGRLIAAV